MILLILYIFAAFNALAAQKLEPIYPNLWVHDHSLAQPKAANPHGGYSHFAPSSDSLALGAILVPFPLELPSERGEILYNPLPSYSHRSGMSEWGFGWDAALSIHRYSDIGEVDCAGDQFISPWGKLLLNGPGDAYYLRGFDLDLRVIKSSEGFIAYHPDGRTFFFTESYGDFAWYLHEVKDRVGHLTTYDYERNQLGRPYLKTVRYGGKRHRQYEIELLYEKVVNPIETFGSCGLQNTIDKIVRQVVIKSWDGDQFNVFKRAVLEHKNRYLAGVELEFPSGEKLPGIQYEYDGFQRFLKQPYKISKTNLRDLVDGITGWNFFLTSLSYVDINQDGRIDFERSDNLKSYLQGDEGRFTFHQEFSLKPTDHLCSRMDYRTRRLLLRPSGLQDDLHYLLLANDLSGRTTSTQIVVCSLDGRLRYEKQMFGFLEPGFFFKDYTHLVDLNGDSKPDVVRVAYNEYVYFLNESTPTEIKFSKPARKSLPRMNELGAKAFFFGDMNGDHFIDLIAQTRHGLMVWYGKGNAVFEQKPVSFRFQTPFNADLDLMSADLVFVDINRDGLMDAYFYDGLEAHFFVNGGDRFFIEYFNEFKKKRPVVYGYLTLLNINGTFDDQLMIWAGIINGIVYYDLNGPSTGLLTRIDNGQGIVLDFEYQWTKPKPGVPKPFIVPKSTSVSIAGKGTRKTEYEFIDPKVNLATGQLLGFGQVRTKGAQISVLTEYFTSIEHSPKPVQVHKRDDRVAGIVEVEIYDWRTNILDGILYPKLIQTVQSYVSKGEQIVRRYVDFLDYERLCSNRTRESTSAGVFERLISYFDSRACLKANQTLVGPDFSYTTLIDYNQAGLPTNLELATAEERLPKIALGYDEEFNLKNVTEPGRGTTFLHYDPVFEILSSLKFPDGTWREMTGYSAQADAISSLLLKGSSAESLTQIFVYDESHRLKQISTNLGQQLEYSYRLPNQTAPGVLSEAFTKTAILSSADGESLTQGKQSQTGWYFGPLHRTILAQNKEQQVDLSSLRLNPAELTFQDLESANTVLSETETSDLLGILSRDFAVSSNHRNYITNRYEVDAVGLKATSKENNQYVTQAILDLSTSQPVAYTDELNQTYTYERDVLGRLRKITLPDGNTYTIDFDAFGRVSNITRSNVGSAVYTYDNTNDRLSEKTVLGVRETYEYDAAGRIEIMLRGLERYKFSYEGSAVAQVEHAEFTKKFSYTPDDKPKLKMLTTKSGLSINLESGYDNFRNLIEQNVSNKYTKQFVYDDYRQLGLVRIGNQTFSIIRNSLGKISKIDLPNNQTFYVDYDPLTHGRIGHSSHQGSYGWNLNNRGLVDHAQFTSSADTCDPRMLNFVYAADKTLQEFPSNHNQSKSLSPAVRRLYDENRHRIGKYRGDKLEHIRFEGIVATAEHIYEKFSIEGIDLGILIDGQFQPCLFDQVGSLLAIGDFVSVPSAFGERKEYLPIFKYFDYAGLGRDPDTGLIAMGERDYDPRMHQFTTPDHFFLESPEECVRSPQECDLFSYAKNNPLIYTDSTGRMVDIALDVGFIALSAYELYKQPNAVNAVALGLDIASAALPAVAGLGQIYKVGKATDKIADVVQVPKIVEMPKQTASTSGFSGRQGYELKNLSPHSNRNEPTTIFGRPFSGHSLDQMQNRGIPPSVVEHTIKSGKPYSTRPGTSGFYDHVNGIRVITNSRTGNVITVIRGKP